MKHFLVRLFLFLLFFFLSGLSFPSKTSAQTCSQFYPLGGNSNICSDQACEVKILGKDCKQPSLGCKLNPFCKKFTGTQCCIETLGYDSCNQTFVNPNFACPAATPFNGFTCCFNPAPTPSPTPTATPTPTGCPGCPTPTPTPFPCVDQSGLQYSCFDSIDGCPGWTESAHNSDPGGTTCNRSGADLCCWRPAPTPTPTNAPTPTPTIIPCSNWNNCDSCIAVDAGRANNCGWKNGSTCQAGDATCPSGATAWSYSDCSIDECVVPTSTPIPTATPTTAPTAGPTPTTAPTVAPTTAPTI